jgi:hypothetical protein
LTPTLRSGTIRNRVAVLSVLAAHADLGSDRPPA